VVPLSRSKCARHDRGQGRTCAAGGGKAAPYSGAPHSAAPLCRLRHPGRAVGRGSQRGGGRRADAARPRFPARSTAGGKNGAMHRSGTDRATLLWSSGAMPGNTPFPRWGLGLVRACGRLAPDTHSHGRMLLPVRGPTFFLSGPTPAGVLPGPAGPPPPPRGGRRPLTMPGVLRYFSGFAVPARHVCRGGEPVPPRHLRPPFTGPGGPSARRSPPRSSVDPGLFTQKKPGWFRPFRPHGGRHLRVAESPA